MNKLLTDAEIETIRNAWNLDELSPGEIELMADRADIALLLADREERTRLLREALKREYRLYHESECEQQTEEPCFCGLDALLAEIRKAVKK